MGRIKTANIKAKAHDLMKHFEGKFTTNFDENKQFILKNTVIKSKKIRNILAGYITRLMRMSKTY